MSYSITPRHVIGCPEPPTTRPKLALPVKSLLVHYTGDAQGGQDFGTVARPDLEDAKALARFGISAGKTWEYNLLVGWQGNIYEQAGFYRAAHCLNWNEQSIGVLMMVSVNVWPTPEMINAFRWLMYHLKELKALTPDAEIVPHYRYRATGCCGSTLADLPGKPWNSPTGEGSVGNVRPMLLQSWIPAPTTPTPSLPKDDDMPNKFVRNGNHPTDSGDTQWNAFICFPGGKYWLPTGEALALAQKEYGPPTDVDDNYMRSSGPVVGPNPVAATSGDPWGCWTKL